MPNNINDYIFKDYDCTNNITLDFDTNKWSFITDNSKDGICKLYFVNSKYKTNITVNNGVLDENNKLIVDREKDGIFKINPNEGYEFKEVLCDNDKKTTWNNANNTLSISNITQEINCTVEFEKKKFSVSVNVKNGSESTKLNAYYGDAKKFTVTPKEGYSNPIISCTNNQNAVYENNNLSFNKITNNTNCVVTFKKQGVNCTFNGELTQGAEFVHGQYTYRYKQEKDFMEWINMDADGWGSNIN